MILAATAIPASPAIINYVYPTLSLLTVALLGYIARKVAVAVRKYRAEHEWLMETVQANTAAIKTMLEQREKLLDQDGRRGRR